MHEIINKVINNPWLVVAFLLKKICRILPDKLQLSIFHKCYVGKFVNWKNPKTFTEKLQWLKIYNRHSEYTTMVDKYAVKQYVADIIGEDYIIPTLGVWNKPEEIDWDILPNQFVLKTTHGGGGNGVFICKDKNMFNKEKCIKKLRKSLKSDLYWLFREWPYKNVPKRIIAEKYIEEDIGEKEADLLDYKFFCFNGETEFFKIDFNRQVEHRANYYSSNGNIMNFGEVVCPPDFNKKLNMPINFDKMINFANKLSNNIPFVRIDFYNVNGKIYFGEITFYPASGFGQFTPSNYNDILGKMIKLPINTR